MNYNNFNNYHLSQQYAYPFHKIYEDYNKLLEEKKKELKHLDVKVSKKPETIKLPKICKRDLEEQNKRIEQWKKEEKFYQNYLPKPKEPLTKYNGRIPLRPEEFTFKLNIFKNQKLTWHEDNYIYQMNQSRYFLNGELNTILDVRIFYYLVYNNQNYLIFKQFFKLHEIKDEIDDILKLKNKEYLISSLEFNPRKYLNSYRIYYNNYVYPFSLMIHGIKVFYPNETGVLEARESETIYFN